MADKQVRARVKSTEAVEKAVETHGTSVGKALDEGFSPFLKKGEKMPDFELALDLVSRSMTGATDTLNNASDAHEKELKDDVKPKSDRDDKVAKLRVDMTDLRAMVERFLGQVALKTLGLEGQTPMDPGQLRKLAERTAAALRNKKVELPKPRLAGLTIDRAALATQIEKSATALGESMKTVLREDREAEATLAAKWDAMSKNDLAFSRGVKWIVATFELAGATELASRVRPSSRRAGVLAEVEESEPEPDTTEESTENVSDTPQ
jgi:hypothetical protein